MPPVVYRVGRGIVVGARRGRFDTNIVRLAGGKKDIALELGDTGQNITVFGI
jgi:hypothetical protein